MKGKTGGSAKSGKKRADGGSIPPMKMTPPQAYKHGGAVGGMKTGGRLDKYARGGRMTPSSPLSGAGNMKTQPYENGGVPATVARGKGGDSTEHS